ETAQAGEYTPLARPLFIYVKNTSYTDNAATKEYVDFYIDNLPEIAKTAQFIPLKDTDFAETKSAVEAIK
ncbi:MAG: phosphate ABC transporter substrate-binding protein, partial [Aeromicrobium sp.]